MTILRAGRSPSIAYGFGSGFASDIAGIKHSNSIGASFQTGDAEAYGTGIGSTNNGNIFAGGIGLAQTNPNTYRTYPVYSTPYASPTYSSYPYNLGYNHFGAQQLRNSYGNPISAQNLGYGTSVAQAQNGPFGSVASASNFNSYQPRNGFRNGFGGSVASAVSNGNGATAVSSSDGYGRATSLAHTVDEQGGYNAAVAGTENIGGVSASTAHTVQQNGGAVQHSGATTIDGPGINAAHSHAINTGAGTYY